MSMSKNFEWHKRFKEGQTSTEDGAHKGQLSTSVTNVKQQKVPALVQEN